MARHCRRLGAGLLVALALSGVCACTAEVDRSPAATDSPLSPSTPPPPSSAPATSAAPSPERSRPRCTTLTSTEVKALAQGLVDKNLALVSGASVALPASLQARGFERLAGVTFRGPGVDGQSAVLAVGDPALTPLPVESLARASFTFRSNTKPGSALGRYQERLARSEQNSDALACAQAL